MKKWWKPACLACLLFVAVMAFVGCAGKASIVGYWQSTDDPSAYVEFTQDGNLIIDTGSNIINGTYELLSDNYIKVTVSGLTGLLLTFTGHDNWRYEVTKSDLTLSADSVSKTFTRVNK